MVSEAKTSKQALCVSWWNVIDVEEHADGSLAIIQSASKLVYLS